MSSTPSQIAVEYDVVPGTIYLVDVLHNHHALTHASGKTKDIVLVPQPSEDPLDPLVRIIFVLGLGVLNH
jgi:hypothetical protein